MEEDKRSNQRKLTDEQIEAILKLHMKGATVVDICAYFKVTQRAIIQILQGDTYKDIARPKGYKYKNNARKLTDREVRKIKKSDKSALELAKKYNVSRITIYRIQKNEIYKQIKVK